MVIVVNAEQYLKVELPMAIILSGIVTELKAEQPKNA